jgi:hypothetical protein
MRGVVNQDRMDDKGVQSNACNAKRKLTSDFYSRTLASNAYIPSRFLAHVRSDRSVKYPSRGLSARIPPHKVARGLNAVWDSSVRFCLLFFHMREFFRGVGERASGSCSRTVRRRFLDITWRRASDKSVVSDEKMSSDYWKLWQRINAFIDYVLKVRRSAKNLVAPVSSSSREDGGDTIWEWTRWSD